MTLPLRCAPVVQREVQLGIQTFKIHSYSDGGVSSPGDGMLVTRLVHSGHFHTGPWPVECFQCGKDVAAELRRLGVGTEGKEMVMMMMTMVMTMVMIMMTLVMMVILQTVIAKKMIPDSTPGDIF